MKGKALEKFEEWEDIEELNCDYQISNLGRVKSKARAVEFAYPCGNRTRNISEKILKLKINKKGDRIDSVQCDIRGKSFLISNLVYQYFSNDKSLKEKGFIIYHKDKNPLNNSIDNLKKGTWSESRKMDFKASQRTKEWQKERSKRGAKAMKEKALSKAIEKATEVFNNL